MGLKVFDWSPEGKCCRSRCQTGCPLKSPGRLCLAVLVKPPNVPALSTLMTMGRNLEVRVRRKRLLDGVGDGQGGYCWLETLCQLHSKNKQQLGASGTNKNMPTKEAQGLKRCGQISC